MILLKQYLKKNIKKVKEVWKRWVRHCINVTINI